MDKKQVLLTLVVAVIAGTLSGYASAQFFFPETIKTNHFRIVDKNSAPLVEFTSPPDKAKSWFSVQLNRGGGRVAGGLSPEQDPFINLFDKEKHMRFVLGTLEQEVGMAFLDSKTSKRAGLKVRKDGTPHLELFDAQKKLRAKLFLSADGSPRLEFYDKDGKITWKAQ